MPSGYTAKLNQGPQSFQDFVLGCAHAFVYQLRDMSLDQVPDTVEIDSYYYDKVNQARDALVGFQSLTEQGRQEKTDAHNAKQVKDFLKSNLKANELDERYAEMLRKVEEWSPPSDQHFGLKDYMQQQINESRKFDVHFRKPVVPVSVDEWTATEAESLEWDLKCAVEWLDKQVASKKFYDEWVGVLKKSLDNPAYQE